jgi:hypothetical protein
VPTKLLAAFAVTAVACFAAGLIAASGPLHISLGSSRTAAATSSAESARERPLDGSASSPIRVASSTPPAAPAAESASPAAAREPTAPHGVADPAGAQSPDTGDDGSRLPPDFGYLVVNSPEQDAMVYINGEPMGRAGEKLLVRCGMMLNVRLGTVPVHTWYGRGKPVSVGCQGITSMNMDQAKAMPSGPTSDDAKAAKAAAKASSATPSKRPRYWQPEDI